MKLLMVKQPWLNLIILKVKTLESRYWQKETLNYRGDVLFASSKKSNTLEEVKSIMTPDQFQRFNEIRKKLPHDIFSPCGVAGCVVNITDYRPMNQIEDVDMAFVKYTLGKKVIELNNVRPVVSFPVKGMLGLLNLSAEYESQIRFD